MVFDVARTKEFDPDAALQSALELFWRRGYEATSITDLVEHLGIGRGFHAPRGIDRRDAVPCELVPVALRGRLLPDAERGERGSEAAR